MCSPDPPELVSSRRASIVWIAVVWLSCALLHTVAFPPFDLPEAACLFAVTAALWCLRESAPRWKTYLWVTGSASFVSWLVLLEWLRALTEQAGPIALLAWIGLAAVVSAFPLAWYAALRWAVPRSRKLGGLQRCAVFLGLAGAWVVIEWIRSWFLTGFPWLPLAASQWERPVILQAAAYGGAWTVSFALVLFNLGLAAYLERLYQHVKTRRSRHCPEFYLGLAALFAVSFALYGDSVGQQREELFKAGAMQPDIPQTVKWDPAKARGILDVLETETRRLAQLEPNAIFWPEAVTPLALLGTPAMQEWIEKLSSETGLPIVLGAVGFEERHPAEPGGPPLDTWLNGLFVVDPVTGLDAQDYYVKRHLVPFGEYVPMRRMLPFIGKFVPIEGDFIAGGDARPVTVRTEAGTTRVGGLICFEDVFPGLARASVKEGAEVLFVATNNGWFGEGGAAFQHAAHSVLRAVETRRPVMRAGNAGWSGWIDEFGVIRDVMLDEHGSIYHRGSAIFNVTRDRRWVGKESLYVRWGDWFVGVSGLLVIAGICVARARRAP
ncbi:MAG: apolipoprotein N-acyltransferase, partial [Opitutaceae bacterium]